MKVEVDIPGSCGGCGFSNFNIWGTITYGKMRLEVRCMRCGKPQSMLNLNIRARETLAREISAKDEKPILIETA